MRDIASKRRYQGTSRKGGDKTSRIILTTIIKKGDESGMREEGGKEELKPIVMVVSCHAGSGGRSSPKNCRTAFPISGFLPPTSVLTECDPVEVCSQLIKTYNNRFSLQATVLSWLIRPALSRSRGNLPPRCQLTSISDCRMDTALSRGFPLHFLRMASFSTWNIVYGCCFVVMGSIRACVLCVCGLNRRGDFKRHSSRSPGWVQDASKCGYNGNDPSDTLPEFPFPGLTRYVSIDSSRSFTS